MKELIEVFKMTEISVETRVRLLIKLGDAINYELGSNITEPVVYELVKILDPNNKQVETDRYKKLTN